MNVSTNSGRVCIKRVVFALLFSPIILAAAVLYGLVIGIVVVLALALGRGANNEGD